MEKKLCVPTPDSQGISVLYGTVLGSKFGQLSWDMLRPKTTFDSTNMARVANWRKGTYQRAPLTLALSRVRIPYQEAGGRYGQFHTSTLVPTCGTSP
jgi:hypothetical protein